ncbi:MAG: protein SCO1/2 [Paracoccaceae bacterium]|jgi:protein SCO1/2
MSMPPRTRLLFTFVLANAVVLFVGVAVLLNRPPVLPQVHGVFLPEAHELPEFELLDHNDTLFTKREIVGRWYLVSYGFTSCPDVCPTILSDLVNVADQLADDDSLRFVFYSVDHRRDTPLKLASYLSYFNPAFIGLTHRDGNDDRHLPFERELGIVSKLVVDESVDPSYYEVNHGIALFLINPDAALQAVFTPSFSLEAGGSFQHQFDPDTIAGDYLKIRRYLAENVP